jgi:ribosomal protein S18 acetylase RimI-like enzyme
MIRRPATTEEKQFVRITWERRMTTKRPDYAPGGVRMERAGAGFVLPFIWSKARKAYIRELLETCNIDVIDVDGMVMGWVAFDVTLDTHVKTQIHFIYVVPQSRRCGIGRMLLEPLIEQGSYEWTHITHAGAALLSACQRSRCQTQRSM